MKRLVAIAFFLSLLFVPTALAQGVEVSIFPRELRIRAESTESIEITITNKLNQANIFIISIFPTSLPGIAIIPEKNSVYLLPGETKTIKVSLIASIDVLERIPQSLQITVYSFDNPNITDSTNVIVISERIVSVIISSLSIDKTEVDPNDAITISVGITNYASAPSDRYLLKTIITKDNEILKTYEDLIVSVPARSVKVYNYTYYFDRYAAPGRYVIFSEMYDNLNNRVSSVTPKSVKVREILNKIVIDKTTSIGVLSASVTVKLKNEGNVPTENFNFTESLPVFASSFFDPEVEPTYAYVERDRLVYKWQFFSLLPGEEVIIRYSFRLWNLWAGLVAIGLAVYFFFKFTFTPIVVKSHRHMGPLTKEKEVSITLEVKNNSLNEIKDVIVRDFVPPIARVVERFETIKPIIKITNRGTELIWKFASLKPREERVLTYKIKPNVDIFGKLNLPPASIRYVDRKKEVKEKLSKSILIKGSKK